MEAIICLLVSCGYVISLRDFHTAKFVSSQFGTFNLQNFTVDFTCHMSHVTYSCRYGGLVQKEIFVILTCNMKNCCRRFVTPASAVVLSEIYLSSQSTIYCGCFIPRFQVRNF
jgi:hypothetical protein